MFAGWSGAVTGDTCPATSTTCTFTINENPEQLIATFNLGTGTPTLTVAPAGSGATGGGTVTGSIGGTGTIIDCMMNGTSTTGTCAQTLTRVDQLNTLTAEANPTSNFAGWTGPCVFITSLGKCVVTMSGTQSVSALFTAQTSSFTVALTGNGTVTSTSTPTVAPEINCANPAPPSACSTNFASGHVGEFDGDAGDGILVHELDGGTMQRQRDESLRLYGEQHEPDERDGAVYDEQFPADGESSGDAGGTVTRTR